MYGLRTIPLTPLKWMLDASVFLDEVIVFVFL
jgi:hypothetical protein